MKGLGFLKDVIKSNFQWTILVISLIILLFVSSKIIDTKRDNSRLHQDLINKTDQYQKLNDYVANLERKYVTERELKERVEKEFKETKKALKGRIKLLSNATFFIRERARKSGKSDFSYDGKRAKFVFNEVRFNNGPPIGYVLIHDDGRVVSKIYNHEIDLKTVISRNEKSGYYNILAKANFILRSGHRKNDGKNWSGVEYPLKIQKGIVYVDPTESNEVSKKFYLWSPSYNFRTNLNKSTISPGLGVSLMGYGYSKRDLDFKFSELGIQYEKEDGIGVTFQPILWRPFSNVLPNTYIGVGISYDRSGRDYFMGLSIGF